VSPKPGTVAASAKGCTIKANAWRELASRLAKSIRLL
jgi:hypothetical protein